MQHTLKLVATVKHEKHETFFLLFKICMTSETPLSKCTNIDWSLPSGPNCLKVYQSNGYKGKAVSVDTRSFLRRVLEGNNSFMSCPVSSKRNKVIWLQITCKFWISTLGKSCFVILKYQILRHVQNIVHVIKKYFALLTMEAITDPSLKRIFDIKCMMEMKNVILLLTNRILETGPQKFSRKKGLIAHRKDWHRKEYRTLLCNPISLILQYLLLRRVVN